MMFVEVNRRVKQNIAFPDPYPGLNKDSDKASTGNAVSSRLVSSINTIG